ncbi:MAG: AcrR family transcriptional regulator [Granulosicoccus sp.]|jgi:AcrR family transcriptional regulator
MNVETPAKDRLLHSGAVLFGQNGYAGVSVREICKHADTSMNMIHHYFESKEGLLKAIINQFSDSVFSVPNKLLENTPRSKEDFQLRIEMIFETTLDACIKERVTLLVVIHEQPSSQAMVDYRKLFVNFMGRCKKKGFIRKKLDSEMITGLMMDRILNQVQYASWIKGATAGDILNDTAYKKRWCKANLDLILHGMLPR